MNTSVSEPSQHLLSVFIEALLAGVIRGNKDINAGDVVFASAVLVVDLLRKHFYFCERSDSDGPYLSLDRTDLSKIEDRRKFMNKMLFLAVAVGLLIFLSTPAQPTRTQENSWSDRNQAVSLAAIGRPNDISENEESTSPIPHRRITGFLAGVGLIVFFVANSKRWD